MTDERLAQVARALANPARITIVRILAAQSDCRGRDIFSSLPLAQSTVSQHLRVLKDAGVVESHVVGTSAVFCLAADVIDEFGAALRDIAAHAETCTPPQKEHPTHD
ncbi:MAG: helix-turn-helix transcriptional regulator [Coriobacteriia bacterium]|nr:helix-turn-helix transcriptional regulator [Coriobacteriia bacterium]